MKTSTGAAEFTLPATDGAAGTVLQTDGSGQLSVATVGSSGIATDAVGSSQIAANAVTASEIAATTITPAQMANSAFLANRNMVINGAMQISQRATSKAAMVSGAFNTVDRWYTTKTNAGTWTQTQDAAVVGTAGFGYSLKNDCTTALGSLAAGDRLMMSYRFEGQNCQSLKKGTASAESVTISFWVNATKTGTYVLEMWDHTNSRHIASLYTVSVTNTWEYKTVTFAGDTTGALNNNNSKTLELHWYLAAGSNYTSGTLATTWAATSNANRAVGQVNAADSTSNNFSLAGVQMEVGITATPFEHQSVGQQLAACKRYYQKASTTTPFTGQCTSGQTYGGEIYFPVTMKGTPTVAQTHITSSSFPGTAPTSSEIQATKFYSTKAADGTANVGFYRMSWTADAEL